MQKNGIVRSSQANRRPNVTKASVRSPRDSVRYALTICGDPTTTVRPPCVCIKTYRDSVRTTHDIRTISTYYLQRHTTAVRSPCVFV